MFWKAHGDQMRRVISLSAIHTPEDAFFHTVTRTLHITLCATLGNTQPLKLPHQPWSLGEVFVSLWLKESKCDVTKEEEEAALLFQAVKQAGP